MASARTCDTDDTDQRLLTKLCPCLGKVLFNHSSVYGLLFTIKMTAFLVTDRLLNCGYLHYQYHFSRYQLFRQCRSVLHCPTPSTLARKPVTIHMYIRIANSFQSDGSDLHDSIFHIRFPTPSMANFTILQLQRSFTIKRTYTGKFHLFQIGSRQINSHTVFLATVLLLIFKSNDQTAIVYRRRNVFHIFFLTFYF